MSDEQRQSLIIRIRETQSEIAALQVRQETQIVALLEMDTITKKRDLVILKVDGINNDRTNTTEIGCSLQLIMDKLQGLITHEEFMTRIKELK